MPVIMMFFFLLSFFFFNNTASTEIYTLSLHDALPIFDVQVLEVALERLRDRGDGQHDGCPAADVARSEEHTSELQSRFDLVCRLLLEKKKKKSQHYFHFRYMNSGFYAAR